MNCSSDLKTFANSRPSASNFKTLSRSLVYFFFTIGQNNFGNKIPFWDCPKKIEFKNSFKVSRDWFISGPVASTSCFGCEVCNKKVKNVKSFGI